MASANPRFDPAASSNLSRNQRDLLLAALHSQATNKPDGGQVRSVVDSAASSGTTLGPSQVSPSTGANHHLTSPHLLDMETLNVDYTPDLDYLDGDNGFDFENADLGGEMIGGLPGGANDANEDQQAEQHEKRKNPDDEDSSEDGADPKRQETQEAERGAKKPGRKPLTSEPTTVSAVPPSVPMD